MPLALIVDDEPAANQLLSMLVELRGYATVAAFTGAEALEKISERTPDVVLLDLMLPDMTGYGVCEAIKTRKETALIPIIMVTARVASQNRAESFAQGAEGYVSKPYTPDQIFAALDEAEAWKRKFREDASDVEGLVRFNAENDEESVRRLSKLRSLVFSRTPLPIDEVRRVGDALQAIGNEAESWGRRRGVSNVASLDCKTGEDCLILTVHDLSGWMRGPERTPIDCCAEALDRARFDAVSTDPSTGTVTLVKGFTNETN